MLRYWLSALRLEEALGARPQARRNRSEPFRPRLDQPTPGQDYFKLPLDRELERVLGGRDEDAALCKAFDGELTAFFETWLHGQYRRGEEEGERTHLLCFPVVHLPRGELAGLLRCGVRLRFAGPGRRSFRVPRLAERQRGLYPDPPDEVRVSGLARAEGAWPFFIDTRLLRHPLGVPSEGIDALFAALRAEGEVDALKMIALVSATLESAARGATEVEPPVIVDSEADLGAALARLQRAMRKSLEQTRAQAYSVGIVLDGNQAKTTWHLQREIEALFEQGGDGGLALNSALGAYLTGRALPAGDAMQKAAFSGPSLTPSQRRAAHRFHGSRLTAVQGPPGTGKTTLILHLCAEALVNQVASAVDGGAMGEELLLIASSNNRAVDNVIDPLCAGDGLPLALRMGSRQVCEEQLAAQLRRTLAWLKRAEVETLHDRNQAFAHSAELYKEVRAELEQVLAPHTRARAVEAERVKLERALAELPPARADVEAGGSAREQNLAPPSEHARPLLNALLPLERRLSALAKLCEAEPGLIQVNRLAHHFGKTAQRELPAFEEALATAKLSLELPLPPLVAPMDLALLMESWEEATEICLHRLAELRERVEHELSAYETEKVRARLEERRAALGPARILPEAEVPEDLSRRLFEAAASVREAWAKLHARELSAALESTLRVVETERSLKPLWRSDPGALSWLRKLFGVWGSTLLSLGNCLPPTAGSVARVVIDEAGQCHPAHAVSALLRCDSALIIGDVHQLTPVIELSDDDEERLLASCRLHTPAELLAPYRVRSTSGVSAQSLADRAVQARIALVDHFRCQPEIIALSDVLCGYGLVVHTPREDRAQLAPLLSHPVLLDDVRGEQVRLFGSLCNEHELERTLELVLQLVARGISAAEIAVITPYRGQFERLRRAFVERCIPLEYSAEFAGSEGSRWSSRSGLALGTVHRFQGGERSVVLFSSVATRVSSLSFLNAQPNLLNVAISRARHHLVCLGHRPTLEQGERTRLLVRAALPLRHEDAQITR